MKDIVKEYPECKLHILGDGDERAESERLVEEYGLQKNVAFYGNIPRATDYSTFVESGGISGFIVSISLYLMLFKPSSIENHYFGS